LIWALSQFCMTYVIKVLDIRRTIPWMDGRGS
jgi:hypothetical protein